MSMYCVSWGFFLQFIYVESKRAYLKWGIDLAASTLLVDPLH